MGFRSCSAGFSEGHVLVWAKESHELWHFNDFNSSNLVDIEMSPCLLEVGIGVCLKGVSWESLMGIKNFVGGSECGLLVHPEFSWWLSTGLGSIVMLNNLGLLFKSVLLDHGSHEDIIGVWCESWGGNSVIIVGLMILNGEVVRFFDGNSLDSDEAEEGTKDKSATASPPWGSGSDPWGFKVPRSKISTEAPLPEEPAMEAAKRSEAPLPVEGLRAKDTM